jgi:pyruvate dehydrogenase E2 component (dihydrolipoamide acetyltransferase)
MAKPVIMPKFGMTQEEATIVRWLVSEGQQVERGDLLCEVTTDKVNMDVEAPADGTITGICFQEGDTVPVTQVIAYILAEGETAPEPESDEPPADGRQAAATQESPQAAKTSPHQNPATPLAKRIAAVEGVELNGVPGSGTGGKITSQDVKRLLQPAAGQTGNESPPGKVRASPAARHLARQNNLPLERIDGTGLEGRIQGWDVAAFLKSSQASEAEASKAIADSDPVDGGPRAAPLEGRRRIIAQRLQASYQQAPHIYLTLEIDMGRAQTLREALNPRQPAGRSPISLTVLIVKACALALAEHPALNCHLKDETLYFFDEIHIGMATAVDEGLIVPVIRSADRKNLNQLGDEVAELSQRARESRLSPDEVAGGTFTISNLGMLGIDQFTAILNPPQVGLLAVGRVRRRFVPGEGDEPEARSLMTVTLAADHRAVDGAVGARFLNGVKNRLENPYLLLE